MLHKIEYYYQKSLDSGIVSMNCQINTYLRNPISGEVKHWPDVHNYQEYINKCYFIAQQFPVDELDQEYRKAKTQNKRELENVLYKVVDALNLLNEKDLNHCMGYTPISHVREQLIALYSKIDSSIQNCRSVSTVSSLRIVPAPRKSILEKIFG